MPAVHLDHLSFRFSSAVEVLDDVTVHLGRGWTGVVGPNGSGKTTLLHLVAGRLVPTSGAVVLDPTTAVCVVCDQEVETLPPAVAAFGVSWDGPDVRLRGKLRLDPAALDRWATLSPGERKRWQIGAARRRGVLMCCCSMSPPITWIVKAGAYWSRRSTGSRAPASSCRTIEGCSTRSRCEHCASPVAAPICGEAATPLRGGVDGCRAGASRAVPQLAA